jgi:hypothetical protein
MLVQGFAELTTLLAEAGDSRDDPIAVAIEHHADCWSRRFLGTFDAQQLRLAQHRSLD